MIQVLEEPIGVTYASLISLAFDVCDEFILVERDQIGLHPNAEALLDRLQPYVKEMKRQDEWPGTRLLGHYADVYYFECNEELKALLLHVSKRLYQWMQPEMPEDLCFLKNGKAWLINSAHERMSVIDTIDRSEILKIREIDGIMIY